MEPKNSKYAGESWLPGQDHGGGDGGEFDQGVHGARHGPDGGTGVVEQIAAVDDQIRLAFLGDGHDLGQDGVEVLFARVPVKDVA
ncbi:hypothetical protein WKI71_45510 [Streptomyces sp. MS1.AVA.1]|uniref:Uncharacterized protein n=1 Tax=Streptomyces machairae TaxID=3134109 RepID=A0ABU8UVU4_9ACTN